MQRITLLWPLIASLYALLGACGLALAIPPGYASPLFPAAGLALAVVLHFGLRSLPGIWLGSMLLNVGVALLNGNLSAGTLLLAAVIGLGATLQAAAGHYLVRRSMPGRWQRLEQERDVVRFLLLGGVLACLLSATCGVTALVLLGVMPASAAPYAWWSWYVGDTLGVLTIAPLLLGLLQRREAEWQARLQTMSLPVLGLLLLSVLTFLGAARWEKRNLEVGLDDEGHVLAQALEQRFIAHREALASMARLFEVVPQLQLRDFEHLTRAVLQDQPDLSALSYNPWVSAAGRDAFEQHLRQAYQDAQLGISERAPTGALLAAAPREAHVPVGYISPLEGNRAALGFDINSEALRRDAIARARQSGQPAATAPIHLVQDRQQHIGLLLLAPAFQPAADAGSEGAMLKGFAVAVVKVEHMVDLAIGHLLPPGLVLELEDLAAAPGQGLLYRSADQEPLAGGAPSWSRQLRMADRTWNLRLLPTAAYLQQQRPMLAWAVGVAGLLFTALLQVLLLGVTGRAALIQRKVEEQTLEIRSKTAELAEREHFLHSLLDFIPGMVAYWDNRLHCVFVNEEHRQWFGKTPAELQGRHVRDMLGATLYQRNRPMLEAVLRGERQLFETLLPKCDGSISHVWVHYIPDVVGGEVRGFFVLASDITVLKQTQLQLEASNAALEQRTHEAEAASRAKTAFVANMSHEIRTPMNAVLGLLGLLQHTALDERQLDYVRKAEGAARSLLAILNDILDFSKVEAGKLALVEQPFRLDELWHNLSVLLSAALQDKPVELLFDIDPQLPAVLRGDALRLQQVLLNLAGNAVKFTERGEVIVRLRLVTQQTDSACVEFSILDTGIGIAAQRLAAVFEGFTQAEDSTSRHYGGTGLGLAISQRLVRLMGSELEVESEPGRGSCFHFRLQLGIDAATCALAAGLRQRDGGREQRVLVVDDHPAAREILRRTLQSFGWQVSLASSGSQALQQVTAAQATGQPYDIILLDWLMPGLDGWDTAERIRALEHGSRHETLLLMVTAQGREQVEQRARGSASPLDAYLLKPVTASQLFDAIIGLRGDLRGAVAQAQPAGCQTAQPLSGLQLLLVEDNALNQQVALGLLEHAGAQVEVADNGVAALQAVAGRQFDAVLMDIQMPDMDGYETTRRLRASGFCAPVIAMTANALPSDRAACLAAGMNDHLGKPIEFDMLVACLLRHTGRDAPAAVLPCSGSLPAAPVPVPALPDLPGFELAAALQRLHGDRAFHARLAGGFIDEQSGLLQRLQAAASSGDAGLLLRELHTLKGLAATLGAMALSLQAAQAEEQVRAQGVAALASQLPLLQPLLHDSIAALRVLQRDFTPPVASTASGWAQRSAAQLDELGLLLHNQDMRALEVFARLRQQVEDPADADFQALEQAILYLDFSLALQRLERLRPPAGA